MTSTNPGPGAEPLLIVGREREIAMIDGVLARRHPALIVVAGEVGAGKTCLLRRTDERAVSQGWQTVRYASGGHLSISADTTTASITELVRRVPLTAHTNTDSVAPSPPPSSDLVEHLGARAPVLFPIDGYRPRPELNTWFRATIDAVKQSAAAVVVLVADVAGMAEDLFSFADDVITLEPLDASAVRQHFELLASRLNIELSQTELDHYVQAVCQNIGRLDQLTAVLQLARPEASSQRS